MQDNQNYDNIFDGYTYEGSSTNMLTSKRCYYCYLIYDTVHDKFYSGVKTESSSNVHTLFKMYFTSSTVLDFRRRLRSNQEQFMYFVEYFESKELAFAAEHTFHHKHHVGKNVKFYNSMTASGSNCGAGTVLCVNTNNETYRISTEEYRSNKNKHKHISTKKMNVTILSTGLKTKIDVSAYDPSLHMSQFTGTVMAVDTETGAKVRVSKLLFDSSDRYVGVTRNIVIAKDMLTNRNVTVSTVCYYTNADRYRGATIGKSSKGVNLGKVACYDIMLNKNVMISKADYDADKKRYLNHAIKQVYICSNKLYSAVHKIPSQDKLTNPITIIQKANFSENLAKFEKQS